MASVFSRTKQGDNTKPKRTSFIPEEEQNSGPEYGRVEVVYNRPEQKDRVKVLEKVGHVVYSSRRAHCKRADQILP